MDEAWTQAWGIGWYGRRREDVVWVMHSGGYYGFITNACFEPKEKVGARFERAPDGRVVSLFFAVARLQRLEPVFADRAGASRVER